MNRLMKSSDLEALKSLWHQVFGDPADFAQTAIGKFAGEQNVFVCEADGAPIAMLLAVPVTMKGEKGAYFYGLATQVEWRGQGKMTALMQYAKEILAQRGCRFVTLIPAGADLFGYYQARGFEKAFALRTLKREIQRNLWAQAEFDSVTAKALLSLRETYCPSAVMLPLSQMMVVLGNLYAQGITIVSSKGGYGLYTRKGKTLCFLEMQAENDRAAERLMEAAREKEVFAEEAVITVGANQTLFLGEGVATEYGMVCFLGERMDLFDGYMRLMLDNE
ncbi:MAG: GNAT family N-acetyltransferase [Faecalibacterium sp.]